MVLFRKKRESCNSDRIVQLTIVQGKNDTDDHAGKIFNLQCGNNFIGRDSFCEVILNSGSVSRRHANLKVSYDMEKFSIVDLGSANGVIVKPSTILRKEKKSISPGDEIQVGEIILMLMAADQSEALQTITVDVKDLLKEVKAENKD